MTSAFRSRHLSLGDNEAAQFHISRNSFNQELDSHLLQGTMTPTPPDANIPITPILHHMTGLDEFITMNNTLDQDGENQFLSIGNCNGQIEFDMSNVLDFMTPPTLGNSMTEAFTSGVKHLTPIKTDLSQNIPDGFFPAVPNMRTSSPLYSTTTDIGLPPWSHHMSLQEPDAVNACLDSWPFFRCNPMPRGIGSPPKTAKIYLEGLAQTLRAQETWNTWTPYLENGDYGLGNKISPEPIVGWSREKLIAITQGFLHKALDIHRAVPASREGSPGSPDSHNAGFLMLPPPNIIQYFLRCYVTRHELYYACNPAGVLDPSQLMHASNGKASSLLVLLMVAHGASSTPSPEARYLYSGLTEACRISLFDIIEKDVYLARDPLVLRSALLFTTVAAWSGDKWHMDVRVADSPCNCRC